MPFPRPTEFLLWLCLSLLVGLLVGCAGRPGGTSAASSPVDTLVLLSAPTAVDVAPAPGPDGIEIKIYALTKSKSKPIAITSGKLEVLLFDGVINEQTPADVKPLRVWTRPAADLKGFANKTAIGVSYPLTLLWGESRPKQDMITIVARYIAPDGRTIYSGPSTIPVGGGKRS